MQQLIRNISASMSRYSSHRRDLNFIYKCNNIFFTCICHICDILGNIWFEINGSTSTKWQCFDIILINICKNILGTRWSERFKLVVRCFSKIIIVMMIVVVTLLFINTSGINRLIIKLPGNAQNYNYLQPNTMLNLHRYSGEAEWVDPTLKRHQGKDAFWQPVRSELIFVTNITNYICGEKIVMWRNFIFQCMTIVGKLKISPHVEKFREILPQ